jgi:hypothetical protein
MKEHVTIEEAGEVPHIIQEEKQDGKPEKFEVDL